MPKQTIQIRVYDDQKIQIAKLTGSKDSVKKSLEDLFRGKL